MVELHNVNTCCCIECIVKRQLPSNKDRWRQGTKLGRTLYIDDICVGMVDTPEIAKSIVDRMNLRGIANTPKKCWRDDCYNSILEGGGLPPSDYCIDHQR